MLYINYMSIIGTYNFIINWELSKTLKDNHFKNQKLFYPLSFIQFLRNLFFTIETTDIMGLEND